MSKVAYVVTSGCYSDYGIEAVFSSRKAAEAFVAVFSDKRSWGAKTIEEWPMNPHAQEVASGLMPWFVRMTPEGNATEVRHEDSTYGIDDATRRDTRGNFIDHMWARDKEHAVKIMNERRIVLLASE